MNWRSFEEWGRSLEGFVTPFLLECIFQHALQSSVMVLPWAALYHVLDPLSGGRIQRLLRTGGPPICQVQDAYLNILLRSVSMRRITSRYFTGIGFMPTSKDMYDRIFQRIKDQVSRQGAVPEKRPPAASPQPAALPGFPRWPGDPGSDRAIPSLRELEDLRPRLLAALVALRSAARAAQEGVAAAFARGCPAADCTLLRHSIAAGCLYRGSTIRDALLCRAQDRWALAA